MSELEVTGEHVARLGDEDLRSLVIKLCEAELRRTGRPSSAVLAGGNQTAPDGGVDVRVQLDALHRAMPEGAATGLPDLTAGSTAPDLQSASTALDFIPRAHTVFQVKCEDMPAGKIKDEMRPKGVLRDSIKELIARKGAYVTVSSKGTVADTFLAKRLNAMREVVIDQPGHQDLKLDFYDRDRLARWVRQHLGVEMWLRERVNARLQGWQGYGPWAGADVAYLFDDKPRLVERTGGGAAKALSVAEGLGQLRATLSTPGQVLRVVGLSGTGKTRFVQALFEHEVGIGKALNQAAVLYTDLGNEPEPSAREMLLRLGALEQQAIVIVDNCNPKTHRTLAEVVCHHKKFISLLTVEYDVADDDAPDTTDVYELTPASDEVLEGILRRMAPHLTGPDRHRITEFSGGNARIGLALARTVDRGETLGVLNDTELFRRLFRQGQADDPELLKAAQVCSLVYSFEGLDTKTDASELRVLAKLAEMTPNELYRHVGNLKRRDVVQARGKWRAVLPPALANRLAKWALQEIPSADITDAFAVSERLLVSFSRRLEYLHDSEEACAIASRWMDDEKWLAEPAQLNTLCLKLFFNLAPLVPDKVLAAMERALNGDAAHEFVLRYQGSLPEWSTLVRHLAYQPALFNRAALLLVSLAEHAEGLNVNCREAWKELFRVGLSGTMALPTQRVQLLEQLLATSTGKRRELTWAAVEAMLEVYHISSSHDFSFGARPQGYGWEPDSHADVVAWFESGFALLRRIAMSENDGFQAARTALAAHFRELWACGVEAQLTALTLELAGNSGWPAGWVATRSTLRFDSDQMSPESLKALKELDDAMAPKGLAQEVRAYTLAQAGGHLDVADAVHDSGLVEDKNRVSSWEQVNQKVVELGMELATSDAVLELVLTELLTEDSGRQYQLGEGLGKGTPDAHRHWQKLRDVFVQLPRAPNISLLAGFINGLRTKDSESAAAILDGLVDVDIVDAHYPALLGTPRNDGDGDRLIASMRRTVAKPHEYQLRTQHDTHGGLSVAKFCEAMAVLSDMENGLVPAIDELGIELRLWTARKVAVPPELVQLAQSLLARFNFNAETHSHSRNVAWRVNELAKVAFSGPDAIEAVAQFTVRFAVALEDYRNHGDEYGDLACTLFRLQPYVALDAFLGKPTRKRNLGFRPRFIARHGPVVQCAPDDVLLQWVSVEPATRAAVLASEIDIFERKKTKASASSLDDGASAVELSPLAVHLLELAPDKASVLQSFNRHLHLGHWSGGLEQTLAPYLSLVESLESHADSVIAAWAHEAVRVMRRRIESDRTMDVIQEQSFE